MKDIKVFNAISKLDEEIIYKASPENADRKRIKAGSFRWMPVAACVIAAAVAAGFTAFGVVSEAKEYNDAVEFFAGNGLSAEGLSRSEIKEVYRDITAYSFTSSLTAEVFKQSVPGLEIDQEEPDPEQMAAIWENEIRNKTVSAGKTVYRKEFIYKRDSKTGYDVLDKSALHCFRDGKPAWTCEFSSLYVEKCVLTDRGTLVWGMSDQASMYDRAFGWIACVDGNGSVVWEYVMDHGFKTEAVLSVIDNGDGTWYAVSRGDYGKNVCLTLIDGQGNELSVKKTETGEICIEQAARLGDGFIVRDTEGTLYKMDTEGNLTGGLLYEADETSYRIEDMTEFGGRVFISAYSFPKCDGYGYGREIANVIANIFSRCEPGALPEISGEELTPMIRENYTALLLVVDIGTGRPETFYSVKGSLGGSLFVNDSGDLDWDVKSVTSTFFSPLTSSYTIGGTCKVFRYSFDKNGALKGQKDTGETVEYRR